MARQRAPGLGLRRTRLGDGGVEGAALAFLGFQPDPAAHALSRLLGHIEAQARASDVGPRVQPPEQVEDLGLMLLRNPDALVADREDPVLRPLAAG